MDVRRTSPIPVPAPPRPTLITTALAVPAVPLLLMTLPSLLATGGNDVTAEAAFAAVAASGPHYELVLLQALGVCALVPAALGVLAVARVAGRGRVPAVVAAVVACTTAVVLLLVLGMELAQLFVLTSAPDAAVGLELSLLINDWSLFILPLIVGLGTALLSLPLFALALWRARAVPLRVLLAFAVPVVAMSLPLAPTPADVVPGLAMLVPTGWLAVSLLRSRGVAGGTRVELPDPVVERAGS